VGLVKIVEPRYPILYNIEMYALKALAIETYAFS
jgi:hypothetical protein